MEKQQGFEKMTPGQWVLRVLQGVLIGVGAMLPGISGGALCVLFGIYQPMMALLSHPFRAFKKYFLLFVPVVIGVGLGFVGSGKLLATFFEANEFLMLCLFLGLIIGVFPSLFREAGEQGRSKKGRISLVISFVVMLAILLMFKYGIKMEVTPNFGWFVVCGVVWGLSMVVPGLSSSNFLLFLGLYAPMSAGIGNLDLSVLISMGLGFIVTILGLARPMNALFEKKYEVAYHFIIGTVLASTIMIIPTEYPAIGTVLIGILLAAIGFFFALWMDKWGEGMKKKANA